MKNLSDIDFLRNAVEKSRESVTKGGYPVGALIVQKDKIIAESISNGKNRKDPTSHAETEAIREACKKLGQRDLKDVVLYSSLEPCLMCLSASFWASITKIVYACSKEKVSGLHFEGDYNSKNIISSFRQKIELIHLSDLEDEALEIILDWEKAKSINS
jgi:guanine deaminase